MIISVRETKRRSDAWVSILLMIGILLPTSILSTTSALGYPYPPHGPIVITDNSEFNATNGVISGTGSPADPFIIDGWDVWGVDAAISISNTNASFLIRNVSLGADSCIRIFNATNGVITQIETHPSSQSILLDHASNITITRATLAYGGYSVYVTDSWNCSINNNSLVKSWTMLVISNSQNISIMDNYFGSNSRNMIVRSSTVIAQNNNFGPSSLVDVLVENDNGSLFRNNSIVSYYGDGFWIYDSINTTVEGNHFSDVDLNYDIPYGTGIFLINSSNIDGLNNDIIQRTYAIKQIDSQYCRFSGNSIGRSTTGILSINSSDTTVLDNVMTTDSTAMVLQRTKDSIISTNQIQSKDFGIQLDQSQRIRFENNVVNTSGSMGRGISLSYSDNVSIINGSLIAASVSVKIDHGDNVTLRGAYLRALYCVQISYSLDSLIDSCTIAPIERFVNPLSIGIDIEDSRRISISNNEIIGWGVYAKRTAEIQINGNNIPSPLYGLYLESSHDYSISGNTFSGQESGINLESDDYNITISSNYFTNSSIRARSSINTQIINNTFSGPGMEMYSLCTGSNIVGNRFFDWSGLTLHEARGITIEGNNFSYRGIAIWGSSREDYTSNAIKSDNLLGGKPIYYYKGETEVSISNASIGQIIIVDTASVNISKVDIESTCDAILIAYAKNVTIQRSNIISNEIGIRLMYVNQTLIHHNNFINNVQHIWATESNVTYYLAYPFGGNYWSNYNGSDLRSGVDQNVTGSDGFLDAPYVGPNGTDAYPLAFRYTNMAPIAIVHISPSIGNLSTIFIFDASSSMDLEDSISFLQVRWDFNGDGIWDTNWSANKTAFHKYLTTANYLVRFQIIDTYGAVTNYSSSVVVGKGGNTNPPPSQPPFEQPLIPIVIILISMMLALFGLGYSLSHSLIKIRQANQDKADDNEGSNEHANIGGKYSGGNGSHPIKGSRGGGVKPD